MVESKKVSIIVPVYNTEKYVDKCLNSLLKQRYRNIEIIVINDGSSDKSLEVVKRIAEQNSDVIKVIDCSNHGVSYARNYGIRVASGEFITFVDSDDWVDMHYLENLVDGYKNDVDISMIGYRTVTEEGDVLFQTKDTGKCIYSQKEVFERINNPTLFQGYVTNKLFKRKIIIDNEIFFDESIKVLEDYLFCCKYLSHVRGGYYNPKSQYNYLQRKSSVMKGTGISRNPSQIKALEQVRRIEIDSTVFNDEIKDRLSNLMIAVYYSNELFIKYDKKTIIKYVDMINEVNGNLTAKHRIMLVIMKHFSYLSFVISRLISKRRA